MFAPSVVAKIHSRRSPGIVTAAQPTFGVMKLKLTDSPSAVIIGWPAPIVTGRTVGAEGHR